MAKETFRKPHLIKALTLETLSKKLERLRKDGRKEVAERLRGAFDDGQDDDFVDNAELEAARNEQSALEGEILRLEEILSNYEIIDERKTRRKTIAVGSWATIIEDGEREEERYEIVGAIDADPSAGAISNESPLGKALLGAKVGDVVDVHAPRGIIRFKIKKIG